ncbi:Ig-like domain-containing protein [Nocardioides daeguensis]|uniref:Ig-like domain-containing protein n=1 Tax=Nocardioides daeguensis TaxID=908359 RepID=A0ABP6UUK6_9ACTN|nr:Ig-like domain-containing protein [Nocardioides daeguensis]MBV6725924.1 fibronectin type III domain-containing protein [Nocardioides daeguensis]MCR1772561.1 fibronectin type III domain-containing protein [Nocardioides daeguensis]
MTTKLRRWRRTASASALTLLLGTLVVLAFEHDGKPFTEVDLNDGGVWVTNRDLGLVARLNPQIKELDLGVDAASADFDIFQRAANLYVDDESSERAVKPVDVARAKALEPTGLPAGAVVAQGGTTFAVVDKVSGKAWVRSAERFRAFAAKSTPPDLEHALSAAVGTDGQAWVLGRDGRATPFTLDESGNAVAGDAVELGEGVGSDPEMVALTVVGDTPVLFNRQSLELTRPDADPVVVETADPTQVELQQPSAASDDVYVATREGLLATPVGGGKLRTVSRGDVAGRPAAPVQMTGTGCVYAAWSDPQSPHNYLRDCAGETHDDSSPISGMQAGAFLQFRVNRDVIVLNDSVTGDSWLVQDPGKAKIDNWPAVDPQNQNKSKLKEITEEVPDQENRPPEPQDDALGARPGRSTVLPVVALNDHDPDGDIISISKVEPLGGTDIEVKIVGGGTQLQVAVPADASGTSTFRYYVTDGRVNDEVFATVTLQIRANGQNVKPEKMPKREPRLTVASGASSSYYLLADYYDKDGDDLTLTSATVRGGEVEWRPDGTITFSDTGAGGKVSEIEFTVEDGASVLSGTLPVEILGDTAPPELVPDLATGVADTAVVVQPLTNDRNPEGTDLTLKSVKVVGDDAGTEISTDLETGTFTFRSVKARSYYLSYAAYNSSATKTSMIRLDIESPPKDNRPPIAVRDKAAIVPGGTAQVDLLLNDLDPDGDVLVVKRIGRPSVPGVKVSVVDKRLAVVSSAADLVGEPATVDYWVSDGRSTVVGQLVIAQRRTTEQNRHPIANKDQATVRAGAVTTIPVLANDSDPDGAKPRLFQSDLRNDQDLDVWVAGDSLRLRAPEKPGTYSVIYGVRDAEGLRAAADVDIFVIPDSAKNNQPPLPQPITDRVIAGRPKVIGVDLGGADPDGDSVTFRSILTAPALGRIIDTGVDWIRYEAFDDKTGTDFFQIRVQDKYGATGVAQVRVGVVPEETENQPPVALDDSVLVQPNRTISYNVLTNDVDPDDDALRIVGLNSTTRPEPKHDDGFVELEVGDAPETGTAATNIGYSIEDAAGAKDNAVLKVTASHDAPFYAPIARDDVAELGEVIGRDPGETVEIPVLDNDLDFDGAKADLSVTGCDAGSRGECEVGADEASVRVRLAAQDQVVLYSLDDADEESTGTFGVIYVTGTDNVPPQLTTDEDLVPVKAVAGEPVVFDLKDIVVTRAGREPRIVPDAFPTAVNGSVDVADASPTSLVFTPGRNRVGAASVTVKVSDGRTAAEDAALESLLTIPIDVRPSGNVPPEMRDASLDVTLDGDPGEVDLAGLTRDANEDDLKTMTWTVDSADSGLSASIGSDSSVLSIEAGGGARNGDTPQVEVVADDGHGGRDEAVVTVRVVGTDRPVVTVPPISVTATRDEELSVDIADYAVNPYPGEPLEVSDARVEGDGQLRGLETDGSRVRFTPTATGTSVVRLTVADASGDPERNGTARITVTVVAVPDAPQRPLLSSVEASSAVLSWQEPAANGAPIEQYEVTAPGTGYQQSCADPTCRLVGLTPGEAYSFVVRARNREGWSDPSPASEEIVPNKAPELMSPPTIVTEAKPTGSRMDRQLTVRWSAPANEGSPITSYEIKEAGGATIWTASGSARSLVIPGLTNGTPYAFEIRAVNDVEPRRQFSGASKAVAPFGVPVRSGAAPQLTASEAGAVTQEPWVRIDWARWSESQSNGNPVSSYEITCNGCNRSTYTVDAATTSRTFDPSDGIEKGKIVTFTVAATNDAGTSDRSPGVSGRPWTKAGPVRNLGEVGSSPSDKTAVIAWDPPADDGGLAIRHYVVQSGSWSTEVNAAPGGGGQQITFPENGNHEVRVWAVTMNGSSPVDGASSSVSNVLTWGKPGEPTTTGSVENDWYAINLPIKPGAENGLPVTGVEISVGGGDFARLNTGSYYVKVPEGGTQQTIKVRTVSQAEGERKYSNEISMTGKSRAKVLTIDFSCNSAGANCGLELHAGGFPDAQNAAHATYSETTLQNPDRCNLDTPIGMSYDGRWYGSCVFSNAGKVAITIAGVPARNY